jgi:photosystem II stability/assembly factor-like uncharacterized protein
MRGTLLAIGALAVLPLPALAQRGEEREDNPRLRMEDFYRRRAYPFDRIPAGALQRARAQARVMRLSLLSAAAPPPISGTQWEALGPTSIPISGTSIGRIATVALDPTNSDVVYIGGAQGGVWKTTDGGANWTPLTDNECSLAMGSIAIDPVDPNIVYAGTGEQNFSADSYWGCGVLRSTDGGGSWTPIGPSGLQTTAYWSQISRIVVAPSTAGTPSTTTLLVGAHARYSSAVRGLYRSIDGGGNWSKVLSGSVTDLVLDPSNDSVGYAAVGGGSVYKTTDQGATWSAVASGFPSSNVGRINLGIAPSAPATLYAAVENAPDGSLLGIWKTTTGGTTWSQLTASGASCGSQCWYDLFIATSPTDPDTVYLGGVSLYRSADGGASFANIQGGIHVDQHAIAFDPQSPSTVYVGNDGGVYRSSNSGSNWTSLNAGLSLTQFYEGISLHPSDQTIVMGGTQDNGTLQYYGQPAWSIVIGGDGGYTAIDYDNPVTRYGETQWQSNSGYSGPRRSDGGSYLLKVSGIALGDRAQFIPPLVMDPNHSATLYFGTYRIYRTTDRAESWGPISPDLTGGSGKISAIAPAPSNDQVLYSGANTGQVYVTSDGGSTWNSRGTGLPARYVEDFALDRADWQTAYVALSGFGSGHVYRTTDAGQTWNDVSSNLPDIPVNAVIVDPASRGIVMVGTDVGVFLSSDSGGTWTPIDQGLPNVAVFDIAYNPATATLIAATHGRGMFALQLNRSLTLAVVPGVQRDTAMQGATDVRTDSAAVVLTGTGAGSSAWNATHGSAAWITLVNAAGTSSGTLTWTRDPTGLAAGTYVDTLTVTAAGAVDSPWMLFDSLVVQGALTLTVSPTSRSANIIAGTTDPLADSATVTLSGSGAATATWSAGAAKGTWLTFVTAGGTGSGMLRWQYNASALTAGTYVDTITVAAAGAAGSPATLVDTLVVAYPALAVAPTLATKTGTSGSADLIHDTAQVTLDGGNDLTTTWTATHGSAAWLTLGTTSGTGSGSITWTRSARDLKPGSYTDTIRVVTAKADTAVIVDRFTVNAPVVGATCAAQHLLGSACLDDTQLRYLDLVGNADGTYNLGDFLAHLVSGGSAVAAKGGSR